MNRKSKRAELAARIKVLFDTSDPSTELEFLGRVMQDVYLRQRENGHSVHIDSGFHSVQRAEKETSR